MNSGPFEMNRSGSMLELLLGPAAVMCLVVGSFLGAEPASCSVLGAAPPSEVAELTSAGGDGGDGRSVALCRPDRRRRRLPGC